MTGTGIKHLKHGEDDWSSNQTWINYDSLWRREKKSFLIMFLRQPSSLQSIGVFSPSLWTCWHADVSIIGYREAAPVWMAEWPPNICPSAFSSPPGRFPQSATAGLQGSFPTATALTPIQQLQVFLQPSPVSSALMQQILSDLTL